MLDDKEGEGGEDKEGGDEDDVDAEQRRQGRGGHHIGNDKDDDKDKENGSSKPTIDASSTATARPRSPRKWPLSPRTDGQRQAETDSHPLRHRSHRHRQLSHGDNAASGEK